MNSVEVKLIFDLRSEFKTRLSKIAETVLTTIPLERKICAQLGRLTKRLLELKPPPIPTETATISRF